VIRRWWWKSVITFFGSVFPPSPSPSVKGEMEGEVSLQVSASAQKEKTDGVKRAHYAEGTIYPE